MCYPDMSEMLPAPACAPCVCPLRVPHFAPRAELSGPQSQWYPHFCSPFQSAPARYLLQATGLLTLRPPESVPLLSSNRLFQTDSRGLNLPLH